MRPFSSLRLRNLVFLILLLSGIVPLAISSYLLIRQNREILETQEKSYLTRSAQFLSVELSSFLANTRRQVEQLAITVDALPGDTLAEKLAPSWVGDRVRSFLETNQQLVALRLLDANGAGPQYATVDLSPEVLTALQAAFAETGADGQPAYRFVPQRQDEAPVAVVAVAPGGSGLVVEAVIEVTPMTTFFREEAQGDVAVFLIDRSGSVLYSVGSDEATDTAVASSELVQDFVNVPLNLTAEYALPVDGATRQVLGRVSPVAEPGWGVVVQKPVATAFAAVRQMVLQTAISTAILVALAMAMAAFAARAISRPIQQLTETSHKIAEGSFGERVEVAGVGVEIDQLARDFNRMSLTVQDYVERLQQAAQANRELFIGSMRAFVAAIDAKDPYTRGHSERVAAHSRTIARWLGLDTEAQHRVWVGALLHDVGKIGIEDRILKKGGVLTDDEFEQMKQHPTIGADIMERIEQLREMIPAIRWHHEAWNGTGYPEGLRAEEIPLMARIVAVADTFDAITTNRPYQRAYEPEFAVERITELAGQRFDAKVVTAFLQAFKSGEIQIREAPPVAPADQQPDLTAVAST